MGRRRDAGDGNLRENGKQEVGGAGGSWWEGGWGCSRGLGQVASKKFQR